MPPEDGASVQAVAADRTYLGGPSDPIADLTVFREIPNRRAMA